MLISILNLGFLFFLSLATLIVLRKLAIKINLVDSPSDRKHHNGEIPLVGGIATFLCLSCFLIYHPNIIPNTTIYIICLFILVTVGVLDDKFNICYKKRFLIQAILSIAMMLMGNIQLHTIGDVLGFGSIDLGLFGYIVTIFAVIAAINAFNMIDGIDGLLGGLSIVTFGGLGIMLAHDGQYNIAQLCLVMIVIMFPYILLNLGVFSPSLKVFMGDSGSMLIGFTVIWFLLLSSQNGTSPPLRPVTALWLIGIPLMDMMTIMIRRIRRGDSPFRPDRKHLHHICQQIGLNSTQTLIFICSIGILFAGIGIGSEMLNIPAYIMFYAFIACFGVYFTLLSRIECNTKES